MRGQFVRAFVHSAVHRNQMPIRLLPLISALAVSLVLPAGAQASGYVPDEVIVRYEDGTSGGVAAQVTAAAGAEAIQALPGGSEQLQIDDGDSVRETIAELRADPNVAYAVPNWRAYAAASAVNDPGFRLQWNFFDEYGINVVEAWALAEQSGAAGGRGAVVAVLDSDAAAIARAIRYAARNRADVINLSLEFPAEVRAAEIPDVLSAIRYAHRRGAVLVAAAGNQADIAVAYPARADSVIAVGATTVTGCQAEYSNAGEDLDLMAPGGGVDAPNADSAWDRAHCSPDASGRPIIQQTFTRGVQRFGLPRTYEGTSMASPHVSAIAALLIASERLGPNPSPRAVEVHLEATARRTDRPDRYGAGLVDAAAALRPATP